MCFLYKELRDFFTNLFQFALYSLVVQFLRTVPAALGDSFASIPQCSKFVNTFLQSFSNFFALFFAASLPTLQPLRLFVFRFATLHTIALSFPFVKYFFKSFSNFFLVLSVLDLPSTALRVYHSHFLLSIPFDKIFDIFLTIF